MIANAITYCRIIISMLMFLFSVFSPEFYVCYLLAGISDMIDGTIARKLGQSMQRALRMRITIVKSGFR